MVFPLLVFTLFAFFFAAAAISPAFIPLQEAWGFNSLDMTIAFSSYSIAMLGSLLIFGPSSDYIGRKPVIAIALSIQIISMLCFCFMRDIHGLIAARTIQGVATGIANGALAAAILDNTPIKKPQLGPLLTGLAPLAGLAMGATVSGVVVKYVDQPVKHIFFSLAIIKILILIALPFTQESVKKRSGFFGSLVPNFSISKSSREAIFQCVPVLVTTWSIGCLYLTLVPMIFHDVFAIRDNFTVGLTIAFLYIPACLSTLLLRNMPITKVIIASLILLILGVILMFIAEVFVVPIIFYVGTVVSGLGFGGGFSNSLKEIGRRIKQNERAAAFALVFIISYLALVIPALLAGYFADRIGIQKTILIFNVVLLLLASKGISLQLYILRSNWCQKD